MGSRPQQRLAIAGNDQLGDAGHRRVQDAVLHSLGDYRGKTVVLYFFPRADTPG